MTTIGAYAWADEIFTIFNMLVENSSDMVFFNATPSGRKSGLGKLVSIAEDLEQCLTQSGNIEFPAVLHLLDESVDVSSKWRYAKLDALGRLSEFRERIEVCIQNPKQMYAHLSRQLVNDLANSLTLRGDRWGKSWWDQNTRVELEHSLEPFGWIYDSAEIPYEVILDSTKIILSVLLEFNATACTPVTKDKIITRSGGFYADGFKQAKRLGYYDAKTNVGCWLTDSGMKLARLLYYGQRK